MPFSTLRQFATFHTSISLRGVLFLSRPKTNTCLSVKKNTNKELFESVLQSCSLITFNSGFNKNLGVINAGRSTIVTLISFISLNLSLFNFFFLHLIYPLRFSCSPSLFNVRPKLAYQSFIVYRNTLFKFRSGSFSQCLFLSIILFFTLYLFFFGLLTNLMIMSFIVLTNFSRPFF